MRSQGAKLALSALWIALSILPGVGTIGCRSHSASSRHIHLNPRDNTSVPKTDRTHATTAHQRFQASVRRTRYELHSHKPFKEVSVPLIFHDDKPFVQASWSGRQIECEVDTGTDGIIYPGWLNLPAQPLHMTAKVSGPHGAFTPAEWVVSPEITLGGYSVYNAVVMAEHVSQPPPTASHTQKVPLLGMQMFLGVVVTIDYASKRLTMRSLDYDFMHKPHKPHSLISHFPTDQRPTVVVPGTMAGHPCRFMLDTGCQSLLINSSFARRYLSVVPIRIPPATNVSGAGITWPGVYHVPCTLLGQHFTAPLALLNDESYSSDAWLGGRWFERFKVTIDYYRENVLMEPNFKSDK